jgi:alanine dehydrogenase
VTSRYVEMIADLGLAGACEKVSALRGGINVYEGVLTCPAVADAHGLPQAELKL